MATIYKHPVPRLTEKEREKLRQAAEMLIEVKIIAKTISLEKWTGYVCRTHARQQDPDVMALKSLSEALEKAGDELDWLYTKFNHGFPEGVTYDVTVKDNGGDVAHRFLAQTEGEVNQIKSEFTNPSYRITAEVSP